jgi:hypothetical protein
VLVEQEGREFRLAFGNISKARLVPDYSALGQAHSAGASDAEDVEEASIYDDPDVKTAPKRPGRGR